MTLLEFILFYVQKMNWWIFPIDASSKRPHRIAAPNGYKDATSDDTEALKIWTRFPDAGVGLACRPSGILAVDIDPRNNGDETFGALERLHGRVPHTVRAKTGGGGEHILFSAPMDLNIGDSLGPGVDLKWNGYVCIAPSIHPSGVLYEWDAGACPTDTPIAPAPEWIVQKRPASLHANVVCAATESILGIAFAHAGWLGRVIDRNRVCARCPLEHLHTTESGPSSTILFAPKTGAMGRLHCSHTSHGRLTEQQVLSALPADALVRAISALTQGKAV